VLIPLGAGVLSALCVWFSWRTLARCSAIQRSSPSVEEEDELERELLARERNLQLGLGKRNVQVLGRVALFGGTGASFLVFTGGGEYDLVHLLPALLSFAAGLLGWAACGEVYRRIGSLADSWRAVNNRTRRRPTTRSGPV
jgi:hypothetical protein